MTRPICLQVYISHELRERLRAAARSKGVSVSEWVRYLLVDALEGRSPAPPSDPRLDRLSRQSVFTMVGVDALLAGHNDSGLRDKAHKAYGRQCAKLGLAPSSSEGGSDEA